MTRKRRIITIVAGCIAGLVVLLFITAVIVLQSSWFRQYVRDKIISVTEESTGGRVDLASFDFDLWHLRATLNGFVLHGTEPATAPPLFAARTVQVDLRLFSGLKQAIDLRSLIVDQPRANVIVNPDGTTNVPEPKIKKKSDKTALETVVDLAIGHFELRGGGLLFADRQIPLDAKGDNLRAQLDFNRPGQRYQGQVSMAPLYVDYGQGRRLDLKVEVPLTVERDRIAFDRARVSTSKSAVTVSGAVEHLVSPSINATANADVDLAEIDPSLADAGRAVANASFSITDQKIQVSAAHAAVGDSTLDASGVLKDADGNPPGVQFRSHLALGQLGRMFHVAANPDGSVNVEATAKMTGTSDYQLNGRIQGSNIALNAGAKRLTGIQLASGIRADQNRIALEDLKLRALGGEFAGNADIEKMERFHLAGALHNFDLDTLARTFMDKPLGYGGLVSGPVRASGDLKAPGTSGIEGGTQLSVTPSGRGIPVSGTINAQYNGAKDTVQLADSHLSLPHSRLDLSGKLDQQLQVHFRSTDLNDFLPALQATSKEPVKMMPVELKGGSATFAGTLNGNLGSPQLRGHLAVTNAAVEGRQFDRLAADVEASQSGASLQNAEIARGGMRIQAAANIGLRNWKALPEQPLNLNLTIRNGDVADLLALAGQPKVPVTGTLNADVHLNGTVANPVGSAQATVVNGVAYDQPFNRAQADIGFSNQKVTLSASSIATPAGNARLNGVFQHPADDFGTGTVQAQLATDSLALGRLQAVDKHVNGLSGTMQANADLSASIDKVKGETQVLVSAVNADLNVRGLQAEGQNYGYLTATARTSGSTVTYRLNSDLAGSTIRVDGRTGLQTDYPTTAEASLQSLPIERLLVLAGHQDLRVSGMLSGTAQVSGTLQNPNATVDLAMTKANVYDEPLDRLALRATYTDRLIDVPRLEIVDGPARIEGSLSYSHAPGDLNNGQAKFQLTSSSVSLDQLHTVQRLRPGLAGTLELMAKGAADIRTANNGEREVLLSTLDADFNATGIASDHRPLGDLRLAARTTGDRLAFNLNSDLAGSKIEGQGQTTLRSGYPTTAEVHFAGLTYTGLRPLIAPDSNPDPMFEVAVDGSVNVDGPVMNTSALIAKANLTRFAIDGRPSPGSGVQKVELHNDGPIVIAFEKGVATVQRARITGPQTELVASGTAGTEPGQPLDLSLKGNTNLAILQQMSRSIYSSGSIVVDATARGTVSKPAVNGRLDLKNASVNYIDFPNGISNANGTILFNANNATIQSLTAESGGGTISATGFLAYGGKIPSYSLKATARDVRVRYPPGASVVARARLDLTGTTDRSLLSGTVLVQKLGFSPKSDFGSLLSQSTTPAQSPAAPIGPLAGMRLDVAIRTASDVSFETTLAENVEATADLALRGTAASPGMLGRVTVTQGDVVFFGSKYTVSQGSVNFYDPSRIRPVLNIDLETVAKGVTVNLNVSGPVDNMKLTHRSDPPLQFNEIVALLATGRTPTSDPNLVAQQPSTPPQSMQQMGESALVSQAIANPVSSRLQRVFGVSQLKIDPTFTSGSELPQARMTLQQQISPTVTFTYITNLNQPNSLILRVEWAFDPQWLVVAQREETGRLGLDFFYKKSFR